MQQLELHAGLRVAYRQEGSGIDVLLIHGIGASSRIWDALQRRLTKHCRVTSIDLPGFGLSDVATDVDYGLEAQAQRLRHIVELLRLEKPIVVASSMGAAIALCALRSDATPLRELIAIAAALHSKSVPRWILRMSHWRFFRRLVASLGAWIFGRHRWTFAPLVRLVVARSTTVDLEMIERYRAPYSFRAAAIECFLLSLRLLANPRVQTSLVGFAHPLTLVIGRNDRVVSPALIRDFSPLAPHAHVLEHPWASHHLMEDDPDWLLELILCALMNNPKSTDGSV